MRANRSRKGLAVVSTLAIATVLVTGAIAAHAQSFQATGNVVAGNASIFATGNTTDITLRSPDAVINWTPSDTATGSAPINFQPSSTTATFKNDPSFTSSFNVLNRILPSTATRAVQFNGNVVSQLVDAQFNTTRGGTVFFYSPGGILVGSTGVFDVGNLALTSSDLSYDPATGAFGTAGTYAFQPANAGSSVQIANGASVTAGPNGAYVALVAPSIVQNGAISVDGSAALVAADAATITFKPSGLFDIQVTSGTSATGTVLSNSGSVGGPAGSSALFNHRIFMVAVPKNDAITMAIASGSSLGFDIAGAADVTGNAIVLSAGQDVFSGLPTLSPSFGAGTGQTDATIGAITATSALTASATGFVAINVASSETSNFASDLGLLAQSNSLGTIFPGTAITVGTGGVLNVGGQIYMDTQATATGSGSSSIILAGGTLHAAQNVILHADGRGQFNGDSGTGGNVRISAIAGTLTVGANLLLSADGIGQTSSVVLTPNGNGTGGLAEISTANGGSIAVGGDLFLSANGRASIIANVPAPGGTATGGVARISGTSSAGSVEIGGNTVLDATASTFNGGKATGGSAVISQSGLAAATLTFHGNLDLAAGGFGGNAATGAAGDGVGGTAGITFANAAHSLTVDGATTVSADGVGGSSGTTGAGGNAAAGTANISSNTGSMTFNGATSVSAFAAGGSNSGGGVSGDALGGFARVDVAGGGQMTFASTLDMIAGAQGGGAAGGATGGTANGGTILVLASGSSTMHLQQAATFDTRAAGGIGIDSGGQAHGGAATLSLSTTSPFLADGNVQIYSDGFGGSGAVAGSGTGGLARISIQGIATFGTGATVSVSASGTGGAGRSAGVVSGNGIGGFATVESSSGAATFNGDLEILANAFGGSGANGIDGGTALGGTVNLSSLDSLSVPGTVTINTATLSAAAYGGSGGNGTNPGQAGGNGGQARAGSITVTGSASNASLSAATLTLDAIALGGAGGLGGFDANGIGGAGGNGGAGTGGTVVIDTRSNYTSPTPSGQMNLGATSISSSGYGGDGGLAAEASPSSPTASGGVGAAGTGGTITIESDRGGSVVNFAGNLTAYSQGVGGDGGGCLSCTLDGGTGTGGMIFVGSLGNTAGNTLTLGGTTLLDSSGFGGSALTTNGSAGTGGFVSLIAGAGLDISASNLSLLALAVGGEQVAADSTGLSGGAALGGFATVESRTGGSILLQSATQLRTTAFGGSGTGAGGSSGSGTGGQSGVTSMGGALTSAGFLTVEADGIGGSGDVLGSGGNGSGGLAILSAGRLTALGNNGTVSLVGQASLSARGVGSTGGTGGTGSGGEVQLIAHGGTVVTTSDISINVAGSGGLSTSLAPGGSGIGGVGVINAIGDIGGGSQLTLTNVNINAVGTGASGNAGFAAGEVGGAGGSGTGGTAIALGEAGNGSLTMALLAIQADGIGGAGGSGAGGDVTDGASGGLGGHGTGGELLLGLRSGADTGSINTGAATFGAITATANGVGGIGGAGGVGLSTTGAGGNGGAADGGHSEFIVRGAHVTTAAVVLNTNAFGGAGGTGSVLGNGGDAAVHANGGLEAPLAVTNRFLQPTQRGTLTTSSMTFLANANAGTGAVNGNSTMADLPLGVFVSNGTIDAGSINIQSSAATVAATATTAPIQVTNGTINVAEQFTFITPGDLSLTLDGGDINTSTAVIRGRNWVLGTPPTIAPGTLNIAGGFFLGSNLDLVAYANLVSPFTTSFNLPGNFRFDNISAAGLTAQVGGSISVGAVNGGFVDLTAGLAIATGALNLSGYADMVAGSSIATGAISAGEGIDFASGGALQIGGPIVVGDSVTFQAGGNMVTGSISAGIVNPSATQGATYDIGLLSATSISTGDLQARNGVAVIAQQQATVGAITGVDVGVLTGSDISLQSITASGRVLLADFSMAALGGTFDGNFDRDAVFAATPVRTAGAIAVAGAIQAGRFDAATQQSFTSSFISSQGRLVIDAGGNLLVGALNAADFTRLTAGGSLQTGNIQSNGTVDLIAGASGVGALLTGNISANQALTFSAAGTLTAGTLFSVDRIIGTSGGDAQFTALQTGNGRGSIEVASTGGSISVGSVRALRDIALVARRSLTTGQVLGRDLLLLAGGNVLTGNVLAGLIVDPATNQVTNATGRAMIAGDALATIGGKFGTYDYSAVFNAAPARASGTVVINGVVLAGRLVSYSSGAMSAQRMNVFGSIEVESGGLVTVAQRWSAPSIDIRSTDIDIRPVSANANATTQTLAGLTTSATGEVTLVSLNPSQALIGDGLSGTGYALSAAELALIQTGTLTIAAQDNAAQPIDMLIGKLALNGPDAGGQISDPLGTVTFATGNVSTRTPGGGIRVIGDVAATGFRTTNTLEFLTGRFELAADTGSIVVTGTNNALSGILGITATNVHIASSSILDKLATDPFYAGVIADLNAPAAIQRPEGVLRAFGLDIVPTRTFYIQNTGTALDPAGFVTTFDATDVTPPEGVTSPGSIALVINGKFQTETGLVGGKDAFDIVINGADQLSNFTSTSQINGCLLNVTVCGQTMDPAPNISSQITLLTSNLIANTPAFTPEPASPDGSAPAGDQPAEKEAEAAETAANPIAPPAPVIDSRPLNPPNQIETPISGGGNPALIGSIVNENTAQGDQQ
jgi:hypothetical protein